MAVGTAAIVVLAAIIGIVGYWMNATNVLTEDAGTATTDGSSVSSQVTPVPTVSMAPPSKVGHLKAILQDVPSSLYVYPDGRDEGTIPPDDYDGPFSVIVSDTRPTDCDAAKRLSYSMFEAIYTDPVLKGSIERVLITAPNYLRSSLGKTDGAGLTASNAWTGPTNFFQTLFSNFEGEQSGVADADATWVVSINGCR